MPVTRRAALPMGLDATSFQIVNPGITLYFDAENDAVIGYVANQTVCRVVAGAPVCAENCWKMWLRDLNRMLRSTDNESTSVAAERVMNLLGKRPLFMRYLGRTNPSGLR